MKPNEWLTNDEFLAKLIFYDKYYITTLTRHLSDFLKNIPVSVITTWDVKHNQIYFTIGDIKQPFKVDVDVSYWDFLYQVENWLIQFYPQYDVVIKEERDITEEEILDMKQQHLLQNKEFDLNEALNMKIEYNRPELGVITKIFMLKDEFVINVNNEQTLRRSGSLVKPLPLSELLRTLRRTEGSEVIRDYIFKNSVHIRTIEPETTKEICYPGKQMLSFCKLHFNELKEFELENLERLEYKWENYYIKFESELLRNDFVDLYKELRSKENVDS